MVRCATGQNVRSEHFLSQCTAWQLQIGQPTTKNFMHFYEKLGSKLENDTFVTNNEKQRDGHKSVWPKIRIREEKIRKWTIAINWMKFFKRFLLTHHLQTSVERRGNLFQEKLSWINRQAMCFKWLRYYFKFLLILDLTKIVWGILRVTIFKFFFVYRFHLEVLIPLLSS